MKKITVSLVIMVLFISKGYKVVFAEEMQADVSTGTIVSVNTDTKTFSGSEVIISSETIKQTDENKLTKSPPSTKKTMFPKTVLNADNLNIRIWGGFTSCNMEGINNKLLGSAYPPLTVAKKVKDGFIVGGDVIKKVMGNISGGIRVSYLMNFLGEVMIPYTDAKVNLFMDTSLITTMIGAIYDIRINNRVLIFANGYLGYGLGSIKHSYYVKSSRFNIDYESYVIYKGSGFAGDISLGCNYEFSRNISLGVIGGYRLAVFPELKVSKVINNPYVNEGDVMKEYSALTGLTGGPVKADFSGPTIGVNLSYKF